jgi:flagellar biosynthesis protein FlhB
VAESSDLERTEAPTPRRRRQAFDEGQVARSQDLTTVALLLGSALVVTGLGPTLARALAAVLGTGLTAAGQTGLDGNAAVSLVQTLGWRALGALSAWLAALALVALVVAGVQARGMLSLKPLQPKLARVNPLENVKRIFGAQGAAELLKAILKLTVIGLAMRATIRAAWGDITALPEQSVFVLGTVIAHRAVQLFAIAGVSYLALAGADYLWQLWQHERRLRMTKEDLRQEMRDTEGNPLVKQRMRSMGRAKARQQMFRAVPTADVVITNPTHIAVALQYDPARAPAPIVVAMGQRKVAERIKAIAREAGVPTVENKPLARALFASAHVGLMIPADLYVAVAEILAFVIRRRIVRGSKLQEVLA